MEVINEAIKCPICKKIFDSPVFLPCGETICKHHVAEKSNLFCVVCGEDHVILNSASLAPNKNLLEIIQRKIDKCDFGTEYKNASDGCKQLEEILDELDLLKRDPCFYIGEIVSQLKSDVDLKREELKEKIDHLKKGELKEKIDREAAAVIEKLVEYENECKVNLKTKEYLAKANEIESYSNEFRAKLENMSNELRILESNETKWKGVKNELEKIVDELRLIAKVFKQDLLLNRNLKIDADKSKAFIGISIETNYSIATTKPLVAFLIELYEKRFNEMLSNPQEPNEEIFDKIEDEFGLIDCESKHFIRALVISVCTSCLADGKIDPELFKKRGKILNKYIARREDFELEALYSIQALDHRTQHQPNFIRILFDLLFDEDIIRVDVFWKWKKDVREEGHQISASSLKPFFEWLSEPEAEPEE